MRLNSTIKNSSFLRDSFTLLSGNMWAQFIAFLAYIFLTRLFSPEDIGIYTVFYSFIDVLIILSTCKYELAIVLADTDREATAVSRHALRLNTIISLVLLPLILVLHYAGKTTGLLQLSFFTSQLPIALLIPLMVFFCGTSRVYSQIFNRFRKFGQIALSEVTGSTSGILFKILFGLPHLAATLWHSLGLSLGTVLGKIVSNINLRLLLHRFNLPKDITRDDRRSAAAKFRNFPRYTMPKDLVNSLSYNLPFIWLAMYFDKAEVGLFSLALTFTFRPANILNNVFEKLFYVRVAEKVREGKSIRSDIFRFAKTLNIVALPLFIIGFIFADSIFGFIFGGRWSGCGYYIRCLLPWIYIMLTSTSLMFLSNVFSKQRTEFIFYIILFVLRIGAVLAGILTASFQTGILLFSISGAIISFALLVWYINLIRNYETREVV